MGPIQSSLNQLTLSALGAIAGVAKGFQGGMGKVPEKTEEKPKVKPASSETKALQDKPVKTGFTTEEEAVLSTMRMGRRSYNKYAGGIAAFNAVNATNSMIQQKASASFSLEERLKDKGGKE